MQSCPEAAFADAKQTKIGQFRVFGCPAVAKVRKRKTVPQGDDDKGINLNSQNIIQRGVRGMFVGSPTNQAGWLICVPQSNKTFTSADVAFDENFETFGLACNKVLHHDSLPVQGRGHTCIDDSRLQDFTGPPQILHSKPQNDILEEPFPHMHEEDVKLVDQCKLIPASSA